MIIALLISTALAHEGHNHAPHGPWVVAKREKVWLDCQTIKKTKIKFSAPFERATFHQKDGLVHDASVLLGPDVKIKVGDVLENPILATEVCDQPYTMTCDENGQPNSPKYKATLKDVYCRGQFNFVLVKDADKEAVKTATSSK